MISKKKTTFGREPRSELDDLDFHFDGFDDGMSSKQEKKRRPIMKLTKNVAKGSLGHLTSESFVRGTLSRALPEGYSTAIETGFEIRDTANQLYNTAATELRKTAPAARRVVDRLLPKTDKFIPKNMRDRLKRFVDEGKNFQSGYGGDDQQLREILAEFQMNNYQDQAQERDRADVKEGIQRQIEQRRFNTNVRALASIDARLAKLSAYNDQIFTRYQRRSLEVQYRQYFTMRDMLKLQTVESAKTFQLLQAIMHNTGLPDGLKAKAREKYGEGLRERLAASSQQAIVGYTQNFFRQIRERAAGGIRNFGSGLNSGLDGMNMTADMIDMMRANGMDVSGESQKMAGGMLASILTSFMAGTVNGSFKRSGFTAQAGARAGRLAGSLPDIVNKWASSPTQQSGFIGSLLQMLKDSTPRHQQTKWLGSSFIQQAGDPGFFSKKTQRSIEEIIPGYLARMLHELRVARTGNESVASPVWSDDKGRFIASTAADRAKTVKEKLFDNRQVKYGRERIKAFADDLTAERELSPGARHELEKAIARSVTSGRAFNPTDFMRRSKELGIDKRYAAEIRRAMQGRFRDQFGRTDEVTLGRFNRSYQALRSTVGDARNAVAARMELGQGDELRALNLITDTDEGHLLNTDSVVNHLVGGKDMMRRTSKGSRNEEEYVGSEFGGMGAAMWSDQRANLYKPGMTNMPVIEANKILAGAYLNAKTFQPIRLMREILDGVLLASSRTILVTADQAPRLVTSSGETLPQYLARTKRAKGRMERASEWISGKVRGVGEGIDNFMDNGKGAEWREKVGWRGRRKARNAVKEATEAFAKKSSAASPVQVTVKAAMDRVNADPYVAQAKAKAKSTWRRAVNAKDYALSLYRNGSLVPVIESEALRAGQYISAATGKVITDMRQLAEGVKWRDGTWVATAEEVAEQLRTSQGTLYASVMDNVQDLMAEKAAKASTSSAPAREAKVAAAFTAKTPVTPSVAAAMSGQSAREGTAPAFTSAGAPEQDPMYALVAEFKEGNLQHLSDILEVMATRDFATSAPATSGEAPSVKKPGFLRRMLGHGWKGARTYGRFVRKTWGLQFKGVGLAARTLGQMVSGVFRSHKDHMGKVPADVFVNGEANPRLSKGAMMAGDYFNADGSPIRVPADIKGIVKDRDGATLIDAEALRKGLHDGQGRSLASRAVSLAWGALTGVAGIYAQGAVLPFRVASAALSGMRSLLEKSRSAVDVYTPDNLVTPKLTVWGMRAGNYRDRLTNKTIHSVKDIHGPVIDVSQKPPRVVLEAEDLSKGLCDIKGRPLPLNKSLLSRLTGGVVAGAGSLLSGAGKFFGNAIHAGASLAALPFRLMSGLFGKKGLGGASLFGRNGDERTHALLGEVLRLLDARLPQSENYRSGSWQDILKKRKAAKDGAGGKKDTMDDGQQSLWSKLWNLFKGKDDEDEDEKNDRRGNGSNRSNMPSNASPDAYNRKDAKGRKRGGFGRNYEAWKKKRARRKGWDAGERTGAGSTRSPGKWYNRLGKGKLGGFATMGAGLLASYGLDKVADHYGDDSTVGKLAGGASTALTGISLVQGLASVLGIEGGAIGLLGSAGGMLASAAGAVGSAALTVGGLLASVITAPVALAAAGIAAAGAGVYYGYKYYSLKKNAPLRKLRMAQYGIDMGKDVWPAGKVQKLEEILLPHVRMSGGTAKIDDKGLDYDAILKLFDLKKSWYNPTGWFHKETPEDEQRKKVFLLWFTYRFRPVFLNWIKARDAVAPNVSLSDLDSDLKPEQKRTLLQAVKAVPGDVLKVTVGPFDDPQLTADAKVIEACYQDALKDLGPETKGSSAAKSAAGVNGVSAKGAVAQLTGKGGAAASASAGASAAIGGLPGQVLAKAQKDKAGLGAAATAMLAVKAPSAKKAFIDSKLSALTAVRYRAYGLTDLDTERVKALFMLETAVLDDVRYDGNGTARFEGDVSYYFTTFAGYFGVSVDDADAKQRWYSWFAKRFIPTVLQFATAVKKANKVVNPLDADDYLNPQHLLDVANMVVASTFTVDKRTASVWSFTDSPFDKQPLNSNSDTVKDNLEALRQAVQKRKSDEETAKKQAIIDAAQKQEQAKGNRSNGRPPAANDAAYVTRQRLEASLPKGLEAGSKAADAWVANGGKPGAPVGVTIKQPGNGTAGDINKLPIPKGTGREAMSELLAAVGRMTGVDPALLDVFAGIESSWNPSAGAATSSAKGLFQFVGGTWREKLGMYASKYGIDPATSPMDPRANALMGAEFIRENQTKLAKALGRQPTDTELYLAHFLGPGGAIQMLKAGDDSIAAAVAGSAAASANPSIFYRSGQALTKGSLMKLMEGKVSKFRGGSTALAAKPYTAPSTGGPTTTTANGPQGGVGMSTPEQRAAMAMRASGDLPGGDGASRLAQVGPKGASPRVPVTASNDPSAAATAPAGMPDAIVQERQARLQRAQAADQVARVTSQQQQDNMGTMTGYLKRQTELLGEISQSLATMLGHTSNLPGIAKSASDAASAPVAQTAAPADTGSSPPERSAAPMPQVPISMARKKYS